MHLPQLLTALTLLTPALGWGMLGHRTTALLASRFLHPHAAREIRQILAPQSLVSASTWADYFSHTPEGRYSAPWHWIDSHDSPPTSCGVVMARDCAGEEGCILSAIVNNTGIAADASVAREGRALALKWVVHFLGDVHQPLHTDNLLRGGNSIQVLWNGRETNLHHVWDSAISEKLVGGNTVRHAATWADALYTEITAGKWKDATAGWGACVDPKTAGDCALLWAQETNTWMCKYVLPATYPEGFAGSELNGTYYDGAIEVVEELVAIAGWRMGMWLNAMFPDESSAAAQEL